MKNTELMTINEFADAVGVSKQAIYKQLNNKLKNYLVIIESKKMLKKSALKEVYNIDNSKQVDNSLNNRLIEMLQAELEQKNTQIADLQQSLDKAQQLLDQEQKLRMVDHTKLLLLEEQNQEQEQEEKPKSFWQRLIRK